MNTKKLALWFIISIVICISLFFGYIFLRWGSLHNFGFGFDPWKDSAFENISVGMIKEEVITHMGKPVDQSQEFRLGQYQGFEEEYERAKRSNSKYYLFWHNGIDITYTIGFDDGDKVVLKASGGT